MHVVIRKYGTSNGYIHKLNIVALKVDKVRITL